MLFPFPVMGRMAATLFIISAPVFLCAQDKLPTDSATIFLNENDTLFTQVDAIASFPGGPSAWARFLVKKLRYPQEAQDNEIMGDTRISFIVDVDGTVSDIKAVSGDLILTAESARIIRLSGKWVPAKYNGQPIKSYRIQPVNFRLESDWGPRGKK